MLSIGEFSKLAHISTRMLRHYDRIGGFDNEKFNIACDIVVNSNILLSENMDKSAITQLDTLAKIETLKGFGFTLAEIAALLPLPQEVLALHIRAQITHTSQAMEKMRKSIRLMEQAIAQMEGIEPMNEPYSVRIMHCPEQNVISIRKTIPPEQIHALFAELHAEMNRRGLQRTGPTQLRFLGEEFSYEAMEVEAQAVVSAHGPNITTIPACLCAAVVHTGPYETIRSAYDALGTWLAKHLEYQVCGPVIERFLCDEEMVQNPGSFSSHTLARNWKRRYDETARIKTQCGW